MASFFDHVNTIRKKNTDPSSYWESLSEEEQESWNSYMIKRFLAMKPDTNQMIANVQHLATMLDDKHEFRLLYEYIPSHGYAQYIKSNRKTSTWPDFMIDILSSYYECSSQKAREYALVIESQSEDERKDCAHFFRDQGFNKKQMNEVKKTLNLS